MAGKELQLLHDALPAARRIACLARRESWDTIEPFLRAAAAQLDLEVVAVFPEPPYDDAAYRSAFARMAAARVEAITVANEGTNNANVRAIAELSLAARLPAISMTPEFASFGGLLEYSPNFQAIFRSAAGYVVRILNGAKPADLPVQQPTTFDFVINLKTAKALGLTLPALLVSRADEVIE